MEKSLTLTQDSSVFSAELFGIFQALRAVYIHDSCPPEIMIFCDSSSAIRATLSVDLTMNETICSIRELISSLFSSGTKTTLVWIPSHIGIVGNERADFLANQEALLTSNVAHNKLQPSEVLSKKKRKWDQTVLDLWKKSCQKDCIRMKQHLRQTPWHFHKKRAVSVCLHRLRTGHHHLNSFSHRCDKEADPSCRQGCEAIENEQHCLLSCRAYQTHRAGLISFLNARNLPTNLQTVLGLNPDIDHPTQYKIRDLLASFLEKSRLIEMI